ncbi:MAG TPA: hypothetical protein VE617_00005, partial [Propionibacteriaceae bacterium]|nr:hypothetical protein [Propionibacteriaceae bacterium]
MSTGVEGGVPVRMGASTWGIEAASDLLITGADLAGAGRADLLIRDGLFADPADAAPATETIAADGLVALPGLVDLHTHLREP